MAGPPLAEILNPLFMFCSFFHHEKHPARTRFLVAVPLGIVAGLICVALAGQSSPEIWNVKNPLLWTLLTDRFLIGLVIGLAGAYTHHPVFGFRMPAFLRGAALGTLVSLPIAFGALTTPIEQIPTGVTLNFIFWATLAAGAIYGLVIDVIATKVGGEGKQLIN